MTSTLMVNLYLRIVQLALACVCIGTHIYIYYIYIWLVVWNIFPYFGNFIIPSDELHHFSEG